MKKEISQNRSENNIVLKLLLEHKLSAFLSLLVLTQLACGSEDFFMCGGIAIAGTLIVAGILYANDPVVKSARNDRKLSSQLKAEERNAKNAEWGSKHKNQEDYRPYKPTQPKPEWMTEENLALLNAMTSSESLEAYILVKLVQADVNPNQLSELNKTDSGQKLLVNLDDAKRQVVLVGAINKRPDLVPRFGRELDAAIKKVVIEVKKRTE